MLHQVLKCSLFSPELKSKDNLRCQKRCLLAYLGDKNKKHTT